MKAVLLTIRLKYFYLTYKSIKTIEIRKSAPKDFVGDVYEVVSKTNFEKDLLEIPENEREFFRQFKGKVGLKFTLNKVEEIKKRRLFDAPFLSEYIYENNETCYSFERKTQLTEEELCKYLKNKNGYAWHIDNLVIFDKPKELSEFYKFGFNRAMDDFMEKELQKPPYPLSPYSVQKEYELTKAPQSWQFIEVGE